MVHPRVARVFEKVFGVSPEALSEETSQETLENWDSMSHIELVLWFEQEFDVRFRTDEFPQMTTMGGIMSILHKKGKLEES